MILSRNKRGAIRGAITRQFFTFLAALLKGLVRKNNFFSESQLSYQQL